MYYTLWVLVAGDYVKLPDAEHSAEDGTVVVTAGSACDPNDDEDHILGKNYEEMKLYNVTLNSSDQLEYEYDFGCKIMAASEEQAMNAMAKKHDCVAVWVSPERKSTTQG